MTIFLPPPIEICRHLRRVVPTAYRPIFRFFWGSKNRKKIDFFWYFFGTSGEHFFWSPDGILPDPGSGQNHGSGQICGFWQVLYGPSQSGQKVDFCIFRTFSRFCRFLRFLHIFEISGLSRLFWTFATFPEICTKVRFYRFVNSTKLSILLLLEIELLDIVSTCDMCHETFCVFGFYVLFF